MAGILEGLFAGLAVQHLVRKVQQDKVQQALEEENYEEAIKLADGSDLNVLTDATLERAQEMKADVGAVKSRLMNLNPNVSFPDHK